MWIKICANTGLSDAAYAVEAGADALGFILAKSPRRVSAEAAAAIIAQLPTHIESYGVFVNPSLEELLRAIDTARFTGVQLHSTSDPDVAAKLRWHAPRIKLLRVLHFPQASLQPVQELAGQLQQLQGDPAFEQSRDAILIDSRTATAPGGTGVSYDWPQAAQVFGSATRSPRMIAAGGLAPNNVAEAIKTLRPWGVDVVSGVELAPGRKDPEKVRLFIQNARAASLV